MHEGRKAIEAPVTTNCTVLGPVSVPEQRAADRVRTVMRIVKVEGARDEGLARLQNISDGGMMLRLQLPVCLGDTVTVHLDDDRRLSAKVVWTEGQNCGVQFANTIDSGGLLNELARRARDGAARPVRLPADAGAVAYTPDGIYPVRVKDVSQRGMKIQHHASFEQGLRVKVLLGPGLERRGVVRWSSGDLAGIHLLEPFAPEDLGSSKLLSHQL